MWYQGSLHTADDISVMEELIEDGHDVNKRDGSGKTPLDYCVKSAGCDENTERQLEKAQFLLGHGADPNLADSVGWTVIHQCAWSGDLRLLQIVVRKGGKAMVKNSEDLLPVELAAIRGHQSIVRYLEVQSGDLRSICRMSIRETMGKRTHCRINELPLPPSMKLFINYGNPYHGWRATVVPPAPWTTEELHHGDLAPGEVAAFIHENASDEFLEDHSEALRENGTTCPYISAANPSTSVVKQKTAMASQQSLIELFQNLYLWESFKTVVDFEEPLARPPRYSMEKKAGLSSEVVGAEGQLCDVC